MLEKRRICDGRFVDDHNPPLQPVSDSFRSFRDLICDRHRIAAITHEMVRTVGPTAARSDAYEGTRKIQLNRYSLDRLISGLQSLAPHLPFSENETGSLPPATDLVRRGGS